MLMHIKNAGMKFPSGSKLAALLAKKKDGTLTLNATLASQ
jgi:hypothetical protein